MIRPSPHTSYLGNYNGDVPSISMVPTGGKGIGPIDAEKIIADMLADFAAKVAADPKYGTRGARK